MDVTREDRRTPTPWWAWPLLLILLPVAVLAGILWLLVAVSLQVIVWATWCRRGRYALVVYSSSPIWREYFEQHVLPSLGARAVVLNWSERKRWRVSLPVILFGVFGGSRDFNPMAIVFKPLTWARRFRFYCAFRAFKHGQRNDVEALRREFFAALDGVTRTAA